MKNGTVPPSNGRGSWLRRPSSTLTYHTISPEPSRYIYSVSCIQFEEHLHAIAQSSSEAPQVTFDDGRLSDYMFGLPLLEKHGIRATFFVAAGLIAKERDFMNWEQVRGIATAGHCVESHGWSHLLLTRATETDLHQELERSKKTLEDKLGSSITALSLPGGRWDRRVLDACADAGYERVYHSDPWRAPEQHGTMRFIGRVMVRNSMGAEKLKALIHGQGPAVAYYRVQHLLKETAKRLIGDQTYHRIWRGVARIARPSNVG